MVDIHVVQRCNVLLRDDELMHGCLRADIFKGQDLIIFIDQICGNLFARDFAKKTVVGHESPVSGLASAKAVLRLLPQLCLNDYAAAIYKVRVSAG